MRTPIFVVSGFLDSGKTTLAKEVLKRTGKSEEWLVLICEHGDEEYGKEYETVSIDALESLDCSLFEDLQSRYPGRRFLLEYNGTWPLTKLYQIGLPKRMVIQNVTYVLDASTAEVYIRNMGPMLLEQMNFADCFYFTKGTPGDRVIKLIGQLNQRAISTDAGSDEGIVRVLKGFSDSGEISMKSRIYTVLLIIILCIIIYFSVNSF
ncbi:GTP-binding protein [Youngiibacter multivorans]|uniref:G3E family GTPase n=1 Tax=Youngiibacter multivorans TaxID=937251 RepID=A0ABS4G7U2_9CLOT|nr:GTP-binding protein [Youngiibacter multivorans]MBP1920604.1 G3E family GTPase [Youngiibacter multivorans]